MLRTNRVMVVLRRSGKKAKRRGTSSRKMLKTSRREATVNLLPSLALTYRLLNSELVERFLTGQPLRVAEQRWQA